MNCVRASCFFRPATGEAGSNAGSKTISFRVLTAGSCFNRGVADRWGRLDGERQLRGLPLNTADGMIAATALEHGLTLVTRNVKDFAGLGVPLLNPWEAP